MTGTSAAGSKDTDAFRAPGAHAALAPSPLPPAADANAGAELASKGVVDKGAAPCVSCHGANGEGNVATGFPRLAGLSAEYLRKQLDDYASGRRANAIMTPIAVALDPAQRRNVAAYYADIPTSNASVNSPPPQQAQAAAPDARRRALTLANAGDEKIHAQACANCHGPDGIGLRPSYPPLGGQNAVYLKSVLGEWRNGSRHNDPSGQMPAIARALSDADVAALADLFASLPPPTLTSP